jgi:L-lactate dehydrogenase complex protein LldF
MIGRDRAAALPYASSLCGACRDVCPVMINIPDLLLQLRHEIKEPGHRSSQSKVGFRRRVGALVEYAACRIWFAAMRNATRYKRTTQLLRFVQGFGGRRKNGARILSVPGWSNFRDMPPVAARSFRERWPEIERSALDNKKQNGKADG